MTYKSIFLIFALLFCTPLAWAQYNQVNDIPYREAAEGYAQERCKLDVYYPTNSQDAPVVVWFHGGGIEGGEKHIDPQLKNSGLVVVAANYRLLPKAPIDDILDDAAAAVAWTYKNIAKYNGSSRKIFVAGHSAGGYLLDIIGMLTRWPPSYRSVDSASHIIIYVSSRASRPSRPPSTSMRRSPMSVLTRRPLSSSPATANWNSSDATRSRLTSGVC